MRPRTLPSLFVSHGSPMLALEPGAAGAFMQALGPAIDAAFGRPRAVVVASAHSLTREPVLLAAPRHATVHDFGGFPEALYQLRYDAPGGDSLAPRVAQGVRDAGLPVHVVADGGLDHGIWVPLRYIYPGVDVPVLPLAFPPDWSPQQLFQLGRALAPLRDDGVLVMGSGSITHNLRMVFSRRAHDRTAADDEPEMAESAAFRRWFVERSTAGDHEALFDYRRQAPHAALMHPTDEHLLPWYVAAGAGHEGPAVRIHDSVTVGCLGMDAYAFGANAPKLTQQLAHTEAAPA
ncbi:MAG TPA: class III extradiol ring-cleavage dioxygenase [Burkholderiaceae bacterium]|nr:class III extradiol ring-cleavage dioxygenase [Burkholderiaceae bacterium]